MDIKKWNSQKVKEIQRLSISSHSVINNLSESIKILASTSTDSPHFDSAMKRIKQANLEADELLRRQQDIINGLK